MTHTGRTRTEPDPHMPEHVGFVVDAIQTVIAVATHREDRIKLINKDQQSANTPNFRPVTEYRLEETQTGWAAEPVYRIISSDDAVIAFVTMPARNEKGWLSADERESRKMLLEAMLATFNELQQEIMQDKPANPGRYLPQRLDLSGLEKIREQK